MHPAGTQQRREDPQDMHGGKDPQSHGKHKGSIPCTGQVCPHQCFNPQSISFVTTGRTGGLHPAGRSPPKPYLLPPLDGYQGITILMGFCI